MMTLLFIIAALIGIGGIGYVFRWSGQNGTGNAPFFRDMPFSIAFGYALAAAALLVAIPLLCPTHYERARRAEPRRDLLQMGGQRVDRFCHRCVPVPPARTKRRHGRHQEAVPLHAFDRRLRHHDDPDLRFRCDLRLLDRPLRPRGNSGRRQRRSGWQSGDGRKPGLSIGNGSIGRDILSRLIYGAQNTVGIAFATTCLAFFIGGSLGFLAAVLGGWLDQLVSRSVDALMAIPSLIFSLLLMTIASVWANRLGISVTIFMILIIAVIDSTRVFRLSRAVGLNIVVMDYIEAAKLRGEGLGYLIFREILPNAYAPLLAEFGLRFCFVFLTIAALSFLGRGHPATARRLGHHGS